MIGPCEVCGLDYCDDVPEDIAYHNQRHDMYVNGVFLPSNPKETVVWRSGKDRIVVIDDSSRDRFRFAASELTATANKEFGHDMRAFSYYGNSEEDFFARILIFCRGKRGLGFAVTSKRCHGWRGTWDEFAAASKTGIKLPTQPPSPTVDVIWVHKKIRGQGIGNLLVSATAKCYQVRRGDLSWYPPFSSDGERLARKANPYEVLISK